jgi:hypothetical protein
MKVHSRPVAERLEVLVQGGIELWGPESHELAVLEPAEPLSPSQLHHCPSHEPLRTRRQGRDFHPDACHLLLDRRT